MTEPFQDYQLQQKLIQLWEAKTTGTLVAEITGCTKTLYLKDGVVVFAATDDPDEKLTQVLIGQGKFTQDQYEAVEPNFNEDVSVGRNLIEMGLITQQELAQGGKEQVYQVFRNIMHAQSGTVAIEEEPLPEGVVSLPPKYPDAFFKILLDFADKSWLSAQFGADLNFVPHRSDKGEPNFSKMDVPDYAAEIYELIDGELDFNHMAFEVDVDDFVLLKFLYALRLLGYIDIVENEDAPEDELPDNFGEVPEEGEEEDEDDGEPLPEPDDVVNELSEALAESDELAQMSDMSMDETVQLSKDMVSDMGEGSMDVTMEISKDALAEAAPGFLDEEDADASEEEPGLDDAPEPDMSVFEDSGDGIAPFQEEPEEEGLDDLGDMSAQIFEEEISKMETHDEPSREEKLEGVIMPGDEEEGEDTVVDEIPPKEQLGPRERRRRLLALTSVLFFVFAGYLFINQPDLGFMGKYLPGGPDPLPDLEEELAAMENEGESTDLETRPPETQSNEIARNDPPQTDTPAQSDQVDKADNTEEQEPTTHQPVADTANAEQVRTLARKPNEKKGFFSPIAEGWDPNTGRPAGENLSYAKAAVPKQETNDGLSPLPPDSPNADTTRNEATSPPMTTKTPPEKTISRGTQSSETVASALADGNYQAAAQSWAQQMQNKADKYTVALFMICETGSVRNTIRDTQGSNLWFLLPRRYNGKDCFWACWGVYDSYREARNAITGMPPSLLAQQQRFVVKPLSNFLP